MKKPVFESPSYKEYLRSRLGAPGTKNGSKSALAAAMNCQATYLSQVLNGKADLNLEQADRANSFFSHTKEESLYFILLVQETERERQVFAVISPNKWKKFERDALFSPRGWDER